MCFLRDWINVLFTEKRELINLFTPQPAAPLGAAELFVEFVFEPSSGGGKLRDTSRSREEPACTNAKHSRYGEHYTIIYFLPKIPKIFPFHIDNEQKKRYNIN